MYLHYIYLHIVFMGMCLNSILLHNWTFFTSVSVPEVHPLDIIWRRFLVMQTWKIKQYWDNQSNTNWCQSTQWHGFPAAKREYKSCLGKKGGSNWNAWGPWGNWASLGWISQKLLESTASQEGGSRKWKTGIKEGLGHTSSFSSFLLYPWVPAARNQVSGSG